MTPTLLIVIPGYNVARTIEDVLRQFSPATLAAVREVVFVDNCSSDDTPGIVRRLQEGGDQLAGRLTLLRNVANYGLGGSLKIGLLYGLHRGVDYVLVIHSDKQGDSEDIARRFIAAVAGGGPDFVMASRFMRGAQLQGYSRLRIAGNHCFNLLTLVLTGHWMSDSGCGIIAVRTSLLRRLKFLGLPENFLFNPHLNVLVHDAAGVTVSEVPLRWSDPEVPSNLRVWRYLAGLTRALVQYRLNRWNLDRLDQADLTRDAHTRLKYELYAAPGAGAVSA